MLFLADSLLTDRVLLASLFGAECDAELRDDLRELLAAEPDSAPERVRQELRVRRLDVLPGLAVTAHPLARLGLAAGLLMLADQRTSGNPLGLSAHPWLRAPLADGLLSGLRLLLARLDTLSLRLLEL